MNPGIAMAYITAARATQSSTWTRQYNADVKAGEYVEVLGSPEADQPTSVKENELGEQHQISWLSLDRQKLLAVDPYCGFVVAAVSCQLDERPPNGPQPTLTHFDCLGLRDVEPTVTISARIAG